MGQVLAQYQHAVRGFDVIEAGVVRRAGGQVGEDTLQQPVLAVRHAAGEILPAHQLL